MGCEAQLAWKYIVTATFWRTIMTRKVGQTDLVLVYDQGLLEGLCMQDYRSMYAADTICATPSIQTHTDSILSSLYE